MGNRKHIFQNSKDPNKSKSQYYKKKDFCRLGIITELIIRSVRNNLAD
jgi:hypothetical protein